MGIRCGIAVFAWALALVATGALAPVGLTAASSDCQVLTSDGRWLSGGPSLRGDVLGIGAATVPWSSVIVLRYPTHVMADRIGRGAALRSGSILGGAVVSVQAGTLTFDADIFGRISLPLRALAALVMNGGHLDRLGILPAPPPGVRLANGDALTGQLTWINQDALGITMAGHRIVPIPRSRTSMVQIADPVPAQGPGQRAQVVRLVSGDLCRGRLEGISDGKFIFATALGKVTIPSAMLVAIWNEGGSVLPLGRMKPSAVEEVPTFDESFGHGEDRTCTGGFLTLDGAICDRGLGCHAGTKLTYDLDGQTADRLIAIVGVDDGVPTGQARFQVLTDGRVAFDSGILHAMGQPQTVAVPLGGVHHLTLVSAAAPGTEGFAGHADWAWCSLILGASGNAP